MAFIYLTGEASPLQVSEDVANAVIAQINDPEHKGLIDVAGRKVRKGSVKQIKQSADLQQKSLEGVHDYYEHRKKIVALPPHERAKMSAWGHFCLFYYALNGTKPNESMKPKVQKKAEEFYAVNPDWARPSVRMWMNLFGNPNTVFQNPIQAHSMRILERAEAEELSAIEYAGR